MNTLIQIPSGSFVMGSEIETPPHEVFVARFFMDTYPVTNKEFKEFIKACPAYQKEEGIKTTGNTYHLYPWRKGLIYPKKKRDHPAVYMNWFVAIAYCNWRSRCEGFDECYDEHNECNFLSNGYRLPTEAEFEYASKGGKNMLYPWGNTIDRTVANYDNLVGDTTEVGQYPPNGYGLYDMSGNIGQWCQDWYDPDYYKNSPDKNPTGPKTGQYKVYRGGSWGTTEDMHICTKRIWMLPFNCNPDFGFRCVRRAL